MLLLIVLSITIDINEALEMKRFTLLELLIVVAVIAILLSLLLPSLGKARLKAKRAVCLSNLSQLNIAQNAYGQNNNGRLAVSSRGTNWSNHSNVSLHAWEKNIFDSLKLNYLNDEAQAFICPIQEAPDTWWEYNNKAKGRLSSYMSATSENLSPKTSAGKSAVMWRKSNENYNVKMLSLVEDSNMMLLADLIRYNPNSAEWNLADKVYKNGNPEGGNELQVNGSAKWHTFQTKQLNYKHSAWPYYWNDPR